MKGRSDNTIDEYRNDLIMFFRFIKKTRSHENEVLDINDIDIDFIKSISIHEMYYFIAGTNKKRSSLPQQEPVELYQYDSSGNTSKPKPILLIIISLKSWKPPKFQNVSQNI
jgi:hypothetical protein